MRLKLLVAIALALAMFAAYRLFLAPPGASGEALAYTECPFRGEPRVTVTPGVAPEDSFPVRMHEEVHARQCRTLGPWKYKMRNLSSRGRLSLEAPAYCAGAQARVRQGEHPRRVRERLLDDADAAFASLSSPQRVRDALRSSCAHLVE